MKRNNKTASGMTKTIKRHKSTSKISKDTTTLSVRGTLDRLATLNFKIKCIDKPHPTDGGYFKKVYVLTESGRLRLKTMKADKANKQ